MILVITDGKKKMSRFPIQERQNDIDKLEIAKKDYPDTPINLVDLYDDPG